METGSLDEKRFLSDVHGARRALERIADVMEAWKAEEADRPLAGHPAASGGDVVEARLYLTGEGDAETAERLAGSAETSILVELEGTTARAVDAHGRYKWYRVPDARGIALDLPDGLRLMHLPLAGPPDAEGSVEFTVPADGVLWALA